MSICHVRPTFIVGLSIGLLAHHASAGDDVDIDAGMAKADWWMADTDVVLVVRQVPFDSEYPALPWPEMVSHDDILGTTRVTRAVVRVEQEILGSVEQPHLELWGAGQQPVAAPDYGIVFGSLWNLEGAGFDPVEAAGEQFFASDAIYSFSPERVLWIQEDVVTDIRSRPMCLLDEGWFRPCEADESPPSIEVFTNRIQQLTSGVQGAHLAGFNL